MDEATSALDPRTEHDISRLKDKMTIIITHKMKNIENCDRVYRLESGSISIV